MDGTVDPLKVINNQVTITKGNLRISDAGGGTEHKTPDGTKKIEMGTQQPESDPSGSDAFQKLYEASLRFSEDMRPEDALATAVDLVGKGTLRERTIEEIAKLLIEKLSTG